MQAIQAEPCAHTSTKWRHWSCENRVQFLWNLFLIGDDVLLHPSFSIGVIDRPNCIQALMVDQPNPRVLSKSAIVSRLSRNASHTERHQSSIAWSRCGPAGAAHT